MQTIHMKNQALFQPDQVVKVDIFHFILSLLVATCHSLINFANSLVPDQGRQNVGPDDDPNRQ